MLRSTSSLLAGAFAAASTANAALVEYWWNITYCDANPDGLYNRTDVIGVNGTWPPPPIYVNQGDTLRVHATNGLGDIGTTLHAHGNFFNGSNYFDGAAQVTQCPIPPGETLTYEIPVTDQTGSYWIHGHYNGQYVDGLRAPLVINASEPRSDNVTWDEEYTIVVGDWYHDNSPHLVSSYFLNWKNPTGAEPVPTSAVIYVAKEGEYLSSDIGHGVDISSDVNNNAYIPFEAGKKYRIRIINTSALAMFHMSLDGHNMTVIELDGIEVEPHVVGGLPIAVAQRYSLLIEAKNETDTNYAWMFYQDQDMYDAVPDDLAVNNSLTIQYSASNPTPDFFYFDEDTWPLFDDTMFTPVEVSASAPADVSHTLNVYFDTYNDGTNRASFNNLTYSMPPVPSLITELTMGNDSWNERIYGAMTHAITLSHLDNIEVVIANWDAGYHPFHLHGHTFQVLKRSFDVTSNDTSINPPLVENQANPSRRDTIVVPPGGQVVVRFRADNPGAWIFHCHIDWHMDSGLAVVFLTDPTWSQSQLTLPAAITEQCAAQGMATSGNVVGLNSTTDFTGEPYGPWPLTLGWTGSAIGALAGCILSALIGFATVVWYGWGSLDDEDIEAEIVRKNQLKKASGGKFGFAKNAVAKIRS